MSLLPKLCHPPWVVRQLDLLKTTYCRSDDGLLVSEIDATGTITNSSPIVPDFGDILPFLAYAGEGAFALRQIEAARRYLSDGLFLADGRVCLFLNHDWLLGLVDVGQMLQSEPLIDLAKQATETIWRDFEHDGYLIDERPQIVRPRSLLLKASPFNLGYVALWLDLYGLTGDVAYLRRSQAIMARWLQTSQFRERGVFCAQYPRATQVALRMIPRKSHKRVLLFKDNTNAVWSLLDLARADCTNPEWRLAIQRWLDGYHDLFFNSGRPFLALDSRFCGLEPSLLSAFSSIDLLCDIAHEGIARAEALALATQIAEAWISLQWDNGLFPIHPSSHRDHLDANVDMVIALLKLAAMLDADHFERAARKAAEAVLTLHAREHGFVLSVNPAGGDACSRYITKYQALVLKLALVPDRGIDLEADTVLLRLLRDR